MSSSSSSYTRKRKREDCSTIAATLSSLVVVCKRLESKKPLQHAVTLLNQRLDSTKTNIPTVPRVN